MYCALCYIEFFGKSAANFRCTHGAAKRHACTTDSSKTVASDGACLGGCGHNRKLNDQFSRKSSLTIVGNISNSFWELRDMGVRLLNVFYDEGQPIIAKKCCLETSSRNLHIRSAPPSLQGYCTDHLHCSRKPLRFQCYKEELCEILQLKLDPFFAVASQVEISTT